MCVHIIITDICIRTYEDTAFQNISKMRSKRQREEAIQNEPKKIKSETSDSTSAEEVDSDETLSIQDDDSMQSKPGERCMLHIGGSVSVTAKTYNRKLQIHIREYVNHGQYPTKKGETLSLPRWRMQENHKEELDKYFEEFHVQKANEDEEDHSIHLGGGIYVTRNQKYPVLNIRHWWKPEDSENACPTRKGVMLTESKWKELTNVMLVIRDFVPELLDSTIGCEDDHNNQLAMLRRSECNPFEYQLN